MDHRLFNDPFVSSITSLEADIFSGGQLPSPAWPDLNLDDDDIHDLSPPVANAATSSSGSGNNRKLSHNAYERDRRKQLNELYSSLRSLLPDADHTKKLSIPTTVSRVLKYIPDLQKQVDDLERKKKELTSANCKLGLSKTSESIAPVVSATCINDMEIMFQISLPTNLAATTLPLSKCIKLLENEGVQLISSSTHSPFENRTFYSLHLQRGKRTMSRECPAFCDELESHQEESRSIAGIRWHVLMIQHAKKLKRNQRMDKERSTFCDELERVVREKAEGETMTKLQENEKFPSPSITYVD